MGKTNEEFEFVNFQLQSARGVGEIIDVEEGLVSGKFNISERCLPKDIDRTCHPHLKGIEIPEVEVKQVFVLIGKDADYVHEVFEVRKPSAPDSQLKALRGPLGWVITGTVQGTPTSKEINVNFTSYDKKLHEQVDNFWKLPLGHRANMNVGLISAITKHQHPTTCPEKTCVQPRYYRGQQRCQEAIMRQDCCGATRK